MTQLTTIFINETRGFIKPICIEYAKKYKEALTHLEIINMIICKSASEPIANGNKVNVEKLIAEHHIIDSKVKRLYADIVRSTGLNDPDGIYRLCSFVEMKEVFEKYKESTDERILRIQNEALQNMIQLVKEYFVWHSSLAGYFETRSNFVWDPIVEELLEV